VRWRTARIAIAGLQESRYRDQHTVLERPEPGIPGGSIS